MRARARLAAGALAVAAGRIGAQAKRQGGALDRIREPDRGLRLEVGATTRLLLRAGAPAALSQPLPRGTEVTVVERRDAWTRIRLASGTAGWVPAGAVEQIAR